MLPRCWLTLNSSVSPQRIALSPAEGFLDGIEIGDDPARAPICSHERSLVIAPFWGFGVTRSETVGFVDDGDAHLPQPFRCLESCGSALIAELRARDGKRKSVFESDHRPLLSRPNLTVIAEALVTRLVFGIIVARSREGPRRIMDRAPSMASVLVGRRLRQRRSQRVRPQDFNRPRLTLRRQHRAAKHNKARSRQCLRRRSGTPNIPQLHQGRYRLLGAGRQ